MTTILVYNAENRVVRITQGLTVTGYAYDAADRRLSLRTGSQVISPTYNPRGNLTYDGVFTYTYDALGRLTRRPG